MSLAYTLHAPHVVHESATNSRTTGSYTFPDGALVLIVFKAQSNGGNVDPAAQFAIDDTGANLTWIPGPACSSGTDDFGTVIVTWIAVGNGTPCTLTIASGDDGFYNSRVEPIHYTGYDTETPIGATYAVVEGPTDGEWLPELSAAPAATSLVFGVLLGPLNNGNSAITEGEDCTELYDAGLTDWYASQTQVRTGSTEEAFGWADVISGGAAYYHEPHAIAIEIRAAAGGAEEDGDYTAGGEITSTFDAAVNAFGALTAAVGSGQALSARAVAAAVLVAGAGAGEGSASARTVVGSVSASSSADEVLSALAQAIDALTEAVAAGEVWAAEADAAAALSAAGQFDAAFVAAVLNAESGLLTAQSTAASDFLSAAETLADLTQSAHLGMAIAAIATAAGQITSGATLASTFAYIAANSRALSASIELTGVFAIAAATVGAFLAATHASAVVVARAATQAALSAGMSFGAAFSGSEGLLSTIPPSSRRITVSERTPAVAAPSRSNVIRVH